MAILILNKCQLVSSSLLLIGREGESCPIASLMQQVDKTCSRRLVFGFGGRISWDCMVALTGLVIWSNSVGLLRILAFSRFRPCRGSFSSSFLCNFQIGLISRRMVRLLWSGLCLYLELTVMLHSLGRHFDHHN